MEATSSHHDIHGPSAGAFLDPTACILSDPSSPLSRSEFACFLIMSTWKLYLAQFGLFCSGMLALASPQLAVSFCHVFAWHEWGGFASSTQ
jgi:hypothetical protein